MKTLYRALSFLLYLLIKSKQCHSKETILNGCCPLGSTCSGGGEEPWITFDDEDPAYRYSFRIRTLSKGCDNNPSKVMINIHDNVSMGDGILNFQAINHYGEKAEAQLKRDGTVDIRVVHPNPNHYIEGYRNHQQFPISSYCVKKENSSWSSIEICCTKLSPCYRKCCPEGEGFDGKGGRCIPLKSLQKWTPPVELEPGKSLPDGVVSAVELRSTIGFPNCFPDNITHISTALIKLDISRIPYTILRNGGVVYLDPTDQKRSWKLIPETVDYCIDSLLLPSNLNDDTCGQHEQDLLLACLEEIPSPSPRPHVIEALRIAYLACLVITMLFLAATAIVHFLLKEKQNIHAWTIQCYVLSQFSFYFFLVIIYVDELKLMSKKLPRNFCIGVGVLTHFFGIYTFAWLSVINFDLWWTFRVLKPLNQKQKHCTRFTKYAIFAIALPVIIVSLSLGLHINFEDTTCRNAIDTTIYPEYGKDLCFLSNSGQLYYFYIPVGGLLSVNLMFYAFTTYKIFKLYKVSQRTSSQKHRQSASLFLKLFLVMGITWIFQVIHAFIDEKEPNWYLVLMDMANMFQAVAIFIIFVCKRETVRALEQKYPIFKGICCRLHVPSLYRTPTLTDRSTDADGSTRISRTDTYKSGVPQEWPQPQEIIPLA